MNLPQLNQPSASANPELCDAFDVVKAVASPPLRKQGRRMIVCHKDEIPVGGKRIVTDGAWSAGVFNIAGSFYAVRNICPHAGAPLCQGTVSGTHLPSGVNEFDPAYGGQILRCPWHGWEFDIITGKGLYDRKSRVATYLVVVDEQGMVVLIR